MGYPSAPAVILYLAVSDYQLFTSMGHALAEQHFNECFVAKQKQFFWRGIHTLPERWSNCVEADGQSFE